MKRYVVLEKAVGETPLAALSAFRAAHTEYADVPMTYAGRLDPMARGKLLILIGDECKRKKQYEKLDKEYEIEVLLDMGSDTGDVLGIVTKSGQETRVDETMIRSVLQKEIGAFNRAYPAFSSKPVYGKPLFLHALEGTLPELPTHRETIYGIELIALKRMTHTELRERIAKQLAQTPVSDDPKKELGADFRITDVRTSWDAAVAGAERDYMVLTLKVACASGTYMRSLAARIGEAFGTHALALSIHRTKLGRRVLGFWVSTYS